MPHDLPGSDLGAPPRPGAAGPAPTVDQLPPDLVSRIREENHNGKCPCVRFHYPTPSALDVYYVLPLEWGGTTDEGNTIYLCSNAVRSVNLLLEHFKREGPYSRVDLRNFPQFIRRLALAAVHLYFRPCQDSGPIAEHEGVRRGRMNQLDASRLAPQQVPRRPKTTAVLDLQQAQAV